MLNGSPSLLTEPQSVSKSSPELLIRLCAAALTCETGWSKCATVNKCIRDDWFCDAGIDCADGSDENIALCGQLTLNQFRPAPMPTTIDSEKRNVVTIGRLRSRATLDPISRTQPTSKIREDGHSKFGVVRLLNANIHCMNSYLVFQGGGCLLTRVCLIPLLFECQLLK